MGDNDESVTRGGDERGASNSTKVARPTCKSKAVDSEIKLFSMVLVMYD